jgi:hypothetical protein
MASQLKLPGVHSVSLWEIIPRFLLTDLINFHSFLPHANLYCYHQNGTDGTRHRSKPVVRAMGWSLGWRK